MTARDSRTSPDYSRTRPPARGARSTASTTAHDGQRRSSGSRRAAQQLVPTFGGRGVARRCRRAPGCRSRSERARVPFFLMPTLGGGDYLRAYPTYRFRDRHALLLRGEYRWAVHKMAGRGGSLRSRRRSRPRSMTLDVREAWRSRSRVGIRVHSKNVKPGPRRPRPRPRRRRVQGRLQRRRSQPAAR